MFCSVLHKGSGGSRASGAKSNPLTVERTASVRLSARGHPGRGRSATIVTVMTLALSRRTFLQQASGTLLSVGRGLLPAAAQNPATQVFYDPATLRHEPDSDHP